MNPDSPRRCGSCGSDLAPGASFCRSCGARYEQPTCDACHAPIVPGAAFCRSCGAPIAAVSTPQPEPTLVRPTPPPAPPPPPPGGRGGRTPLLIAAAIVLLGAGAAAAIVLTGSDGEESSTTTVSAEANTDTTTAGGGNETQIDEAEAESLYPPVGRPEMEEEIEALLLAYHEDVVERDFRSAWALLSSRKRQQNLAEYGYPEWMRAQASLSEDLSPWGLRASMDSLEGKSEGVARVLVTGMGWSAPGSSCGEWSGLTWVKYERGQWTYDPGYSTTDARRRAWEPRTNELLGADC